MKTFRKWFIVAGSALLTLGLTGHAARAAYDSTDTRLPSPSYHSTSPVIYAAPGGPYQIDSFFDIFTDLVRAPGPPDVPAPGNFRINSFFDVFTEIDFQPLGAPAILRESPTKQTIKTTAVSLNGLPPGTPVTFNTEMLQLDISSSDLGSTLPPGVMIRESPTLQSTGKTTITDIGGGLYHIDSFFDVFTELSLDGGQSWIPSNQSLHLDGSGVPEPSTLMLVGLGLIGGTAIRRARRGR